MDLIEMARELGRALQQDERYRRAAADADVVNTSDELREMVGEYEELRGQMEVLAAADSSKNAELIKEIDGQMNRQFEAINAHPLMAQYEVSRHELEHLVNYVLRIVTGAANGEDPDEIGEEACTGSCSTCGGCH